MALAAGAVAALVSDAIVEPRARSLGSPIGPTDSYRIEIARFATTHNGFRPDGPGRLLLLARPPAVFYLVPRVRKPVVRFGDLAALVAAIRPGEDEVILDLATLSSNPPTSPDLVKRLNRPKNVASMRAAEVRLPPTTWADQEPGAVFESQGRGRTSLHYYPVLAP